LDKEKIRVRMDFRAFSLYVPTPLATGTKRFGVSKDSGAFLSQLQLGN
jgi:hypothetical protein